MTPSEKDAQLYLRRCKELEARVSDLEEQRDALIKAGTVLILNPDKDEATARWTSVLGALE